MKLYKIFSLKKKNHLKLFELFLKKKNFFDTFNFYKIFFVVRKQSKLGTAIRKCKILKNSFLLLKKEPFFCFILSCFSVFVLFFFIFYHRAVFFFKKQCRAGKKKNFKKIKNIYFLKRT
jgi:hypothetical protein